MSDTTRPVRPRRSFRLYWLYGQADELLYVGITSRRLNGRMAEHARTKPWWHQVRAVYCRELGTDRYADAAAFERAVIQYRRPRFNVVHNVSGS